MSDVVFPLAQKSPDDPEFSFYCPACKIHHWFKTTGREPRWRFDGDRELPTVFPSIRVKHGPGMSINCHFFIQEGRIQYCSDSTHALAGKTVDMESREE